MGKHRNVLPDRRDLFYRSFTEFVSLLVIILMTHFFFFFRKTFQTFNAKFWIIIENIKLKFSKSIFVVDKINFLGCEIQIGVITPANANIDVIKK